MKQGECGNVEHPPPKKKGTHNKQNGKGAQNIAEQYIEGRMRGTPQNKETPKHEDGLRACRVGHQEKNKTHPHGNGGSPPTVEGNPGLTRVPCHEVPKRGSCPGGLKGAEGEVD